MEAVRGPGSPVVDERRASVSPPEGSEALTSRPMRADAARNHEKILRAAEDAFASEGVMVPIDSIAERAGVGIGTLYRHFPTKEALYEAIVKARITRLIDTARRYERDADPGRALFEFLREFARQASEKRDLFEALNRAGIDLKSQFVDMTVELKLRIDVLRQRAVDVGAIKSEVTTSDILTLVVGSCHASGPQGSDHAGLQRMIDIVIAGIQPSAVS